MQLLFGGRSAAFGQPDSQPGTEAAPLRTIQKAASIARPGDTVLVRGGVYKEHVRLRRSGEPDNPIVFTRRR